MRFNSINYKYKIIVYLIIISFYSSISFAQTENKRKENFNIKKSNLAIEGYDPVSYISKNKAEKGNNSISLIYKGISYNFVSNTNRDLFKSAPDMYEPAYGGWCAYAMGAKGEKVEVDPETFKVINGKTYLFYNFYFNNTLKDWNKEEEKLKVKADNNWKKIIQ
jgi:YHS domain-containing protein